MPTPWLRHYLENRLFEWSMTLALLGNGLVLLFWPHAIEVSLFRFMLLMFTPMQMTALYLVFGLFRSVALVANGGWPIWGPRWRMVGSAGAMLMWSQMAISLVNAVPAQGAPSLSIPTYLALVAGEIYSTFRAARDHGHR